MVAPLKDVFDGKRVDVSEGDICSHSMFIDTYLPIHVLDNDLRIKDHTTKKNERWTNYVL